MFRDKNNPNAVSRWMVHACVAAFWSYAVWPTTDASFFNRVFPACLAVLAMMSTVRAGYGLWQDYVIRAMKDRAAHPSGRFGRADFANLRERLAAGLHDLGGLAFLGLADGVPTFLPTGNLIIVAMQGAGKTSRVLVMTILQLLFTGRSIAINDAKPEFVHLFSKLSTIWFRVVINNPSLKYGLPHDDYNPFHILVDVTCDPARCHEAFPIAESLAKVLVPDVNDGKSRYFIQLDQQVLITVFLALAVLHPELCYPAQAWKHISDPESFLDLLIEAKGSNALDGDLATMARSLLKKDRDNPEHLDGALAGAANALSVFKPSSSLGHYGANHSYDMADARDLTKPPMVVFDIAPADQLEVYAKVLELTNTARLQELKRNPDGREFVFVADEFTALPNRPIATEVEFIRSSNIRLIAACQSLSSLKRVYGEARAESLLGNSAQMYFSVNDLKTAREISERIGEHTIKTESHNFNEGQKPTKSIGETARRRFPTEELLSMDRSQAVLIVPAVHAVMLSTVPWFEVDPVKDQLGENPRERHPKSRVTQLTMIYGKNASELCPPVIPDMEERLLRARQGEPEDHVPVRVPLIRPYKMLWIPLVVGFLAFTLTTGTPHLGFMQTPKRGGGWICGYLGIAGFEIVTSDRGCPSIGWLPPHVEELP